MTLLAMVGFSTVSMYWYLNWDKQVSTWKLMSSGLLWLWSIGVLYSYCTGAGPGFGLWHPRFI